ncbi:hypothetical protein GCM10020219_078310 [Nonomuraea dietziae]
MAAPVKEPTSIADHRVKVYELLTKDGGFFYTASETEKERAVTAHGLVCDRRRRCITCRPLRSRAASRSTGVRWTHKASYIITRIRLRA